MDENIGSSNPNQVSNDAQRRYTEEVGVGEPLPPPENAYRSPAPFDFTVESSMPRIERDISNGRVEANGAGSNGKSSPSFLTEPPSLFWQSPLSEEEEVNWFVPPLPHRQEREAEVLSQLAEFKELIGPKSKRAWLLGWDYLTRASSSAAEHVDVEREADLKFKERLEEAKRDSELINQSIAALKQRETEVQTKLEVAQKDFAESAAHAGLSCEPQIQKYAGPKTGLIDKDRHEDAPPARSGINTRCVEEALQQEVPDLDAVAGEHGVSPIPKQSIWGTILTFFMQFLAPVVCGFMLALCLGTLIGILDLDDFQRRDSLPKFALSAALGFVIVYLMGEIFSHSIHSLTRSLEEPGGEQGEETKRSLAPRVRGGMTIAVALMCAALFLGFAEVIAEANGIRELHRQQIARRERFRATDSTVPREREQPMAIYLIIGTLISGPYLCYKTAKSWGESELHLREAWLLHRQRNWLDDRRSREETRRAFQLACEVEQWENNLFSIRNDLKKEEARRSALQNPEPDKAMQSRRKEARAAAVGEALRLQNIIEEIVEISEPLQTSQRPLIPINPPRAQNR